MKLSEQDILQIMQMYRNNEDLRLIAKHIGISQASVSAIIRAFNGSEQKLELLHKQHRLAIMKLSPFYQKQGVKVIEPEYCVCELFFGLIKFKIKVKTETR